MITQRLRVGEVGVDLGKERVNKDQAGFEDASKMCTACRRSGARGSCSSRCDCRFLILNNQNVLRF